MQIYYLEIVTKEVDGGRPRTQQRMGCSSASRTPGSRQRTDGPNCQKA